MELSSDEIKKIIHSEDLAEYQTLTTQISNTDLNTKDDHSSLYSWCIVNISGLKKT